MAAPVEKLREACLKRGVSGIKTIGKLVAFSSFLRNFVGSLAWVGLKCGMRNFANVRVFFTFALFGIFLKYLLMLLMLRTLQVIHP